jgi:hypothetical protein
MEQIRDVIVVARSARENPIEVVRLNKLSKEMNAVAIIIENSCLFNASLNNPQIEIRGYVLLA